MNVGLATTRSAGRYGRSVAVFDEAGSINWFELDQRSNQVANLVLELDHANRGDRVALLAPNRREVPEVLAGVAKAGFTYVGLNYRLGVEELEHIFDNAEPRLLIAAREFEELAREVAAPRGTSLLILDSDSEQTGYESSLARSSTSAPQTLHEVQPTDDFCIVYTSGTTGTPKGVWFDHGRVLQHATVAALEYELDHQSRYLMAIPHNSSVNITLVPTMIMGGSIGFMDTRGFDAERFVSLVAEFSTTHSYLVPTQLYRLLDQSASSTALQSMTTIGYGAAPMAPDKIADLLHRFGPIFNQLYGMAEVASIATMLRKDDHARAIQGEAHLLRSAGKPSYVMDVRIVDDTGRDVDPGERGEIVFSAPYVMKGYYREPERTRAVLADGWMHSGDIGEADDEGYIYVVDRKKDLIIRGGYNISPSEIEAAIYRHPAVLEVAVVATADEEWGEGILAAVVLKDGEAEVRADEIQRWCRDEAKLPTIKIPQVVRFLDDLPKNAVGKIAKKDIPRD